MDFINYQKVVVSKEFGRCVYNRYFHSWENAKQRLIDEANSYSNNGTWEVEKTINQFNASKGFYEFEIVLRSTSKSNNKMVLSLIECYFCDE